MYGIPQVYGSTPISSRGEPRSGTSFEERERTLTTE